MCFWACRWFSAGLFLQLGFGAQAQPLEVGITHFPPLYIVNTGQPASGLLTHILTKTLVSAGKQYHITAYPPKRLFKNLAAGLVDVTIGIKNNVLPKSTVLYSQKPVTGIELRLYAQTTTPLPIALDNIRGRQLGLIRGFQYGNRRTILEPLKNQGNISNLNTHKNALAMLLKGRIDYLLDYKQPIDNLLTQQLSQQLHHLTIDQFELFFIISKTTPQAAQLLQTLEQTYHNDAN